MIKKIAVLKGDGIGPEVVEQAIKVLEAVSEISNIRFVYIDALIGASAIDKTGNPLPDETIDICNNSDAILLGAVGHPKYDNDPNAKIRPEQGLLKIRKTLGLFANIRPIITYDILNSISPLKEENIKNVDFVVYRELTGGIYFGDKGRKNENEAYDCANYSVEEITRISKLAFEAAQKRAKHLTLVDKANVLETSRLWRETVKKIAKKYPDVTLDFMFVDNAAMQIILNPSFFDVILTENMFGDIITDEASVITGSIGMLPSASVGNKISLFEPIHGSYPQASGKNIANPYGTILSAAYLLDSFDMFEEANKIRKAVEQALNEGYVTIDINKKKYYGTNEIGDYIAKSILSLQ